MTGRPPTPVESEEEEKKNISVPPNRFSHTRERSFAKNRNNYDVHSSYESGKKKHIPSPGDKKFLISHNNSVKPNFQSETY